MLEAKSIIQGDSVGWLVWRDPDGTGPTSLAVDYTCRIVVGGTSIDRAVTELDEAYTGAGADTAFVAGLTLVETAVLAVGQYVVSVKITNTVIGFSGEQHGILTVQSAAPNLAVESDVERLAGELSELRAARHAFLTGGSVKQAWSGRYGNRMTYDNATLADFDAAILRCQRDLDAAIAVEGGGRRRGSTEIYWNH
jgi:hypothetical protein